MTQTRITPLKLETMTKVILTSLCLILLSNSWGQGEIQINSKANRSVAPAQRILIRPTIVDTIIPTPDIKYPQLSRKAETDITVPEVKPANIRIVDKLDKLYRGYARIGVGNYATPLGEIYFNTLRNRNMNMGVHINHLSSFGQVNDTLSPSAFDQTSGRLFGNFFFPRYKLETSIDYLNHGYHFYGIADTADIFPADTFANRVQGIGAGIRFSNMPTRDSGKVLYTFKTSYMYFHEFQPSWDSTDWHARNSNFMVGTELKYKQNKNLFSLDVDVKNNNYWSGESDTSLAPAFRKDEANTILHFRPVISTYGNKWKAVFGADINFDFPSNNVFRVVPVIEGKYSLFNDMFIPYAGINGGLSQNTFYTLNRQNPFIRSSIDLKNTRLFNAYFGIKGTASKALSFDLNMHIKTFDNMALFVNDTIFSAMNKFMVVYDRVNAFGIQASASYQLKEKLKIDLIATWTDYVAVNETEAWNLAPIDITLRGSYNLYDKIYAKLDLNFLAGRKSPEGMLLGLNNEEYTELGFIGDANLHLEYRYNKRISAFLQFNNFAAQRYQRYSRYPVQGFQALGGVTFSF